MIIQCESCSKKFIVRDVDIPREGRSVQCGNCRTTWHQMPDSPPKQTVTKISKKKSTTKVENDLSVDSIKASDGKTYKFLGSQWAVLLPSGKTGLFAKKKIGKELDKITGRKVEYKTEKKKKRERKEVNPSSQSLESSERLPEIYNPNKGMGFFGYIFLLIVIAFSLVGVLKTFEDDLLNNFYEAEYIFSILDEQLVYIAESVKNIIAIINDLINSY